jgi:integrase
MQAVVPGLAAGLVAARWRFETPSERFHPASTGCWGPVVTGGESASPAGQAGVHPTRAAHTESRRRRPNRRERIEHNLYRRASGGRTVFEVGYRDSAGKQRWQTVEGGITAARLVRDDLLGRRGRGERISTNPRLRFGEAADAWLTGQVAGLRPATQKLYRGALETHLRPRWGTRRLDTITVDDVAALVRELRAQGLAEWTIYGATKVLSRIFKFASRRMSWSGTNPVDQLEAEERPKTATAPRRRIYRGQELEQTLAAAREPFRTLFAFAAVTGARLSECLGLVWADLDLADPDEATAMFAMQVDRQGRRQPLKTEAAERTIELPRALAQLLIAHKLRTLDTRPSAFVFASRSGRALMQRNVARALRNAQTKATDQRGRPTFPILHETDERGRPLPAPAGTVPSFHSFRHTAASRAIAAGESAEEVSWQLGHGNSNVTRAVYLHEIRNAERAAQRRGRLQRDYAEALDAASTSLSP